MRHSITFGTGADAKNTWTDWGLLPVRQPVIPSPEVKKRILELPGLDGEIDLSDAITGYTAYSNRTGQIDFIIVESDRKFFPLMNVIKTHLHGQKMRMVLEDEPDWYYYGRFSVNKLACDELHGTISISYNLEPYKWFVRSTLEPWLWNPFSFIDGVITEKIFDGIDISNGAELDFNYNDSGTAPVRPSFTSDVPATVTITQGLTTFTVSLTEWSAKIPPGLVLYRGQWLYNGRPAALSVTQNGSATQTLAIVQQPVSVTGAASTTVSFHVEATGEDLTYQWQYKNVSGGGWTTPTGTTFGGKDTPTVTVPVTAARNGYQFRCIVSSGGSSVTSEPGTVTTATPEFAIVMNPHRQTVDVGDDAAFYCGAQGSGLTYQWQKKTQFSDWENLSGKTSYTLKLADVEAEDHGSQYRCVVKSGANTLESSPAELRVVRGMLNIDFRPGRL